MENDDLVKRAYEVLDLPETAGLRDVKERYGSLTRAENSEKYDWERMKEIDWAYETLTKHLYPRQEVSESQRPQMPVDDLRAGGYTITGYLKERCFPVEEKVNPVYAGGRALFFLFIFFWGIKFMLAPIEGDYVGRSFMHLINLPFHEAGHIVFSFLGNFMGVFGGTLMQILIPFVCVIAFLQRSDAFSASFALWWTGQSFMDAAPYIYDARAGELMLLGGVTGQEAPDYHDWHNMLERLSLLPYDHVIAYASKYIGVILMLLSFAWGGYTLYCQYRNRERT